MELENKSAYFLGKASDTSLRRATVVQYTLDNEGMGNEARTAYRMSLDNNLNDYDKYQEELARRGWLKSPNPESDPPNPIEALHQAHIRLLKDIRQDIEGVAVDASKQTRLELERIANNITTILMH